MLGGLWKVVNWRALATQLHPYPSFEYYQSYLATIESINRHGDPVKRFQIRLIQFILIVISILYLVRILIPPTTEWVWLQVVSFDMEGYNHFPMVYHVIMGILFLSVVFIAEIFYFELYGNPMHDVLYECLVLDRRDFVFNNQTMQLRKFMVLLVRATRQSFTAIHLFVFGAIYQLGNALVHMSWFGLNATTTMLVPVFILGALFFTFSNYITLAICNLSLIIILGTSLIFQVRHKMMTQWLRPGGGGGGERRRVLRFVRDNIITLVYVGYENRFYGKMITLILCSHLPMNGMFIITSFRLASLNLYQSMAQMALAFNQMILLQAVHYLSARFSTRLHHNYPAVISLYVANGPRWRLKDRLRVAHNIQAFWVEKHYGLTYGRANRHVGLITMMAFVKVLFLFSETIMYNLKLVNPFRTREI